MKTKNTINKQEVTGITGWFEKEVSKFENARFFWMTIYLTVQSCLGSVAVKAILENDASVFVLGLCTAVTMASNALFIAQGSAKLCLGLFYSSIILNTIFIILNF
ncbi:MAG: hypothetical protein L6Q66_02195 [Bacteroidia bacterium]|nr:hypothetical protein [Bacteroidia bacterium]